jgi:integrase/recombinase XerD
VESAIIQEWIDWLGRVRNARGATLDAYSRTLIAFREFIGDVPWDSVDADTVERFMGRKRRGNIVPAPATQDRDRIAISTFYKYLMSRGLVDSNPVDNVGVPKVRNRQPRAIPDDVWVRLWSSSLAREDRAWLGLSCFSGLRRRELVTVGPRHFDLETQTINHLERKGGGTYAVEYGEMARVVNNGLPHLLPDLDDWLADIEWLVDYRRERGGIVLVPFDHPASELTRFRSSLDDEWIPDPANINRRLKQVLRRAGLPETLFSPHALRHTCATNLMRCGVPLEIAADQLSHASIETTRRYLQTGGQLANWRKQSFG